MIHCYLGHGILTDNMAARWNSVNTPISPLNGPEESAVQISEHVYLVFAGLSVILYLGLCTVVSRIRNIDRFDESGDHVVT